MKVNYLCYGLLLLALLLSLNVAHTAVAWFLLASVVTLVIYGADKYAARKSWQRVPEKTLLLFGLAGGWPGALLGQQMFRHKTQKQPFKTWFMLSVVVNVLAVAGFSYWRTTQGI